MTRPHSRINPAVNQSKLLGMTDNTCFDSSLLFNANATYSTQVVLFYFRPLQLLDHQGTNELLARNETRSRGRLSNWWRDEMEMEWMTIRRRRRRFRGPVVGYGRRIRRQTIDYAASQCTNGWINMGDDDDDICCCRKPKPKLPKGLIWAVGKTKHKPEQAGKSHELRIGVGAFFSNLLY